MTNPALHPTDFEALRLERRNGVLRVLIDHPEYDTNPMDELLHGEFMRLFHGLRHEREARAVLLTGANATFSEGGPASPDWLLGMQDLAQVAPHARRVRQMIYNLVDLELPVVCAIQGNASASAANIALLCDIIFMADDATISDPHVAIGLTAGDGGSVIWPLAMGIPQAKRYLFTGDPLTAHDAERLGLITQTVRPAELYAVAAAFAERLALGAPLALQYTKHAVNQIIKQAMVSSFDAALSNLLTTARSEDFVEAINAQGEGRAPVFRGV